MAGCATYLAAGRSATSIDIALVAGDCETRDCNVVAIAFVTIVTNGERTQEKERWLRRLVTIGIGAVELSYGQRERIGRRGATDGIVVDLCGGGCNCDGIEGGD